MKIYIQTETQSAEGGSEPRPRQLLVETAADPTTVQPALEQIAARLGATTAIPAAAHEANLKAILPRDLAGLGIVPGQGAEGLAILKVLRSPGEGDMTQLGYEVLVTGSAAT
jgi:hypothetical protein